MDMLDDVPRTCREHKMSPSDLLCPYSTGNRHLSPAPTPCADR